MRLTLEGAIPTAGTSVTMETKLWNWSSGGYVVVDSRTFAGASDQRFEIELLDNLLPEHPYIRPSDPLDGFGPWLVRAQITWRLPDPNQMFAIKLDSVELGVRD